MMETICSFSAQSTLREFEREFIINSLFFPTIIEQYIGGFQIFVLHNGLAQSCCRIAVEKGDSSAAAGFENYMAKVSNYVFKEYGDPVAPAMFYVQVLGVATISYDNLQKLLRRAPLGNRYHDESGKMIDYVSTYFQKVNPPILKLPFSPEEIDPMIKELDTRGGGFVSRYHHERWKDTKDRHLTMRTVGGSSCINEVVASRMFASGGYNYLPLAPASYFDGWQAAFAHLRASLRKQDSELYVRMLKASLQDKTLRVLLHQRIGPLSSLLDFTPLDPFSLLHDLPTPEVDFEAACEARRDVDKQILKIRTQMAGPRRRIERVVDKCLQTEVKEAIDTIQEIQNDNLSEVVARGFLDKLGQFSSKKFVNSLEGKLDIELSRKQKVSRASSILGDIRLSISGIALMAAQAGLTGRLDSALTGLAGLQVGSGVMARVIKSQLHHLPGFDVYAAFQKWPKLGT